MLCMLLAYDADGNVVATLDYLTLSAPDGGARGTVDFAAIEKAGEPLRLRPDSSAGVWYVPDAVASGTWPEWIRPEGFRVETVGEGRQKRITALVHKTSGHRRERADIEAAIAERIAAADGQPADIGDLVGGPDRPLILDDNGRTVARRENRRPKLPLVWETLQAAAERDEQEKA